MGASATVAAEPEKPVASVSFLDCVHEDLLAVEALLGEEIRSDVRAAYAISGHTLSAGGKRLRPALVNLAARAVHNVIMNQGSHMDQFGSRRRGVNGLGGEG